MRLFTKEPVLREVERRARKTYKLTAAERTEVVHWYVSSTLSCEAIGAMYGIARESVSKMALRAGAVKRRPSHET